MNSFPLDITPELIQAVFDHSLTNIYAAKALRDPTTGELVDFQIYYCNDPFLQRVHYSLDQVKSASLRTLFPALEQSGFLARYKRVVERGELFEGEQAYEGPNGHFYYQTLVKKLNDGIVVNFIDVTDRREAELAAQRTADLLRATLDASISSIFYMRALRQAPTPQTPTGEVIDFLIEYSNAAVLRSNNLRPDEVVGQRLLEKFPGNRANGFFDSYVRVVETGQPERMVQHYRDELGLDGWFEVSTVRQDEHSVVVTFMNITETKLSQLRLEESNRSLDQFAAIASHDLQEPLRKIISFGDLLMNQYGPLMGEGIALVERMQSASRRMQSLIRDLLTYARLTKTGDLFAQPVNLNDILQEVLLDLEMAIAEGQAQIKLHALPTLPGNRLQLRQLFQNLLSNSLKYVQPGRRPMIEVEAQAIDRSELPTEVQLPGMPGYRYWRIRVSDNGIGFGEQYREKIFGAFERLHGKQSSYAGTGMGLAIVRRVMENHQGGVTAQGREGQGATFTLYFPGQD